MSVRAPSFALRSFNEGGYRATRTEHLFLFSLFIHPHPGKMFYELHAEVSSRDGYLFFNLIHNIEIEFLILFFGFAKFNLNLT